MGERTNIAWTAATWNPWVGCTRVSLGCDHCYMFREQERWGQNPTEVRRASDTTFYAPLVWERHAARASLKKLVFTCSYSDFFHQKANPWRKEAWNIMTRTPHLTYQVLTKRPGLAVAWYKVHGWLDNVWLGVSVETAKYLPRLDVLHRVPAPVRFVSCEPLLGPLNLGLSGNRIDDGLSEFDAPVPERVVDWVIVGGESGPHARPMLISWLRDIVRQCQAARVPVFVKQDWHRWPGKQGEIPDDLWKLKEMPNAPHIP